MPAVISIPVRPPLVRPEHGRVVAGVAAGVAAHLGLPVRAVRIVFALTALGGGGGLLLYIWLWALVPSGEVARPAPAGPAVPALGSRPAAPVGPAPPVPLGAPAGPAGPAGPTATTAPIAPIAPLATAPGAPPATMPLPQPAPRRLPSTRIGDLVVGGLLLAGGLVVLGSQIGWQVPIGAALPLIVVVGGAALVYSQLDEVQGTRWAMSGASGRSTALRVVAGVVLVLAGVLLAVIGSTDVAYAGRVLAAVAAMIGGVLVVLTPWGIRFWRDLGAEREARAREAERADIAAHLHDSVLQTLALIQRNSDDAGQVIRLARTQERELRSWLYGGGSARADGRPATLERRVKDVAADVEDLHGVPVDVVVVGDRALDERGEALIAALREAMVNAVRHAGAPVMVYVEALPDGLEAFVRDRGPGFDPAAVPDDRHGVRESIIGRMDRNGGGADVRTVRGEGTEVRLRLPDPEPEAADGSDDAADDGAHDRSAAADSPEVPDGTAPHEQTGVGAGIQPAGAREEAT